MHLKDFKKTFSNAMTDWPLLLFFFFNKLGKTKPKSNTEVEL